MNNRMMIAAAAALFLIGMVASPILAADASNALPDPGHPGYPSGKTPAWPAPFQTELAAASPLYLPLVSKGSSPIPPGVLAVLINQFLLFVPPAGL